MKDFPDKSGSMYTWDKVEIMPSADTTLRELSQRTNCYLATNAKDSSKSDIIKALKRVHIEKFFTDIFSFMEIGFRKPSKEYFKIILKRLNMDNEDIIMIGDSIDSDLSGAQRNGIDMILYDPDDKHQDYKGLKINDLMMLLEL